MLIVERTLPRKRTKHTINCRTCVASLLAARRKVLITTPNAISVSRSLTPSRRQRQTPSSSSQGGRKRRTLTSGTTSILKTFYHWRSILRTEWIIAGCRTLPSRVAGWARLYKAINEKLGLRRRGRARVWVLPTMSPKVRRKNAEDDMLADWLERDADIMSLPMYQEVLKDTRYNKIGH